MGWLEDVYDPAIFQKAPEYFSSLTHFKWFCSSGNVISRCMRTGECHLCSRTRTCFWCCGHPKHWEKLGLQSKHKDTVAIPTQDQIISESIRPCPNTTNAEKGKDAFVMNPNVPFFHFIPYSGADVISRGHLVADLACCPEHWLAQTHFLCGRGIEIWRCHATCTHWMYFNGHLHVTKKKNEIVHGVLYRSKYSDIMKTYKCIILILLLQDVGLFSCALEDKTAPLRCPTVHPDD